jgi:hypothetical protein
MAQKKVHMSVKQSTCESFCEVVGHVDLSIDLFEVQKIALDPFAKKEVLDVHMASPWCWLLSITHSCTSVIVLVDYRGRLLWNSEVPNNASNKQYHFTCVISRHELCLGG